MDDTLIDMDYVVGFLKSKGEDEKKDKKTGMIMVITVAKPKKVGVKKGETTQKFGAFMEQCNTCGNMFMDRKRLLQHQQQTGH